VLGYLYAEMSVPGLRMAWHVRRGGYDVAASGTCMAWRLARNITPPASARHSRGTMSGPAPSTLVLLTDLRTCAPGQKVRFLGWYGPSRASVSPG
jgi:hypothetical protein